MSDNELAKKIIEKLKGDPELLTEGRRNNDTFDLMVAAHVLDLSFAEVTEGMEPDQADTFAEEAVRMIPYIKGYMEVGPSYALSKVVGNYA